MKKRDLYRGIYTLVVTAMVIMPLTPVLAAPRPIAVISDNPVSQVAQPEVVAPEVEAVPAEISTEPAQPADDAALIDMGLQAEETPPLEQTSGGGDSPLDPYANRDNAGAKPTKLLGEHNVDEFSGAFAYSYPVSLPAGRAGLQPQVSLNYNHQRQNVGSMVGFGWELSMSSIERDGRTGLDKLYTDNNFRLNLNGNHELVAIDVDSNGYGLYGKRIESDFLKIEYSSVNKWLVTDKTGMVYTFGSQATSRQDNPSDSTKVYRWMLEEIRDTNDNFVRYEYFKDFGQIYPKKIFYTGSGTTDGTFEVWFEPFASGSQTENNLVSISETAGFTVQTKYLLDKIDVYADGVKSRSDDLNFGLNDSGKKYLLNSITPKAYKDAQEYSKDTVNFDYSYEVASFTPSGDYQLPSGYELYLQPGLGSSRRAMFIDLNLDGYADYINMTCNSSAVTVNVFNNNTTGGWNDVSNYDTSFVFSGCSHSTTIPATFAEMNGDHYIDLVTNSGYYPNTGSGWGSLVAGSLPASLLQSTTSNKPINSLIFTDLNRDGYDDAYYNHSTSSLDSAVTAYIKNKTTGVWTQDNDYNISLQLDYADCFRYGGTPFGFADVNNDGSEDVFYDYYCHPEQHTTYSGEVVYLNNGTSLALSADYAAPANMSWYSISAYNGQNISFLSDFNRDGLQDKGGYSRDQWVDGTGPHSSGGMSLLGVSVFDTVTFDGYSYFTNAVPVAVVDLNGDQAQDAIHSYSGDGDRIYYGQGIKNDILTNIDGQSGASVRVAYGNSSQEKDSTGSLLNPNLPFDTQIVKEVVVNDGQENLTGQSYTYSDGSVASYTNENIKDVYGFGKVTKKIGQALVDVDLGDGSDGSFNSNMDYIFTADKDFTYFTVNSGHKVTIQPGVKVKVQGTATINGSLFAKGTGYPEQAGPGAGADGQMSTYGPSGGGGGAGFVFNGESSGGYEGQYIVSGGVAYGNSELEPALRGSGGGKGGYKQGEAIARGGSGGGIIILNTKNLTVNGEINADGNGGESWTSTGYQNSGGAGGGSGGSIYIRVAETANIGTNMVHARGGAGGLGAYGNDGGDGSIGRIRIEAPTIVGSTDPAYFSLGSVGYTVDGNPADSQLRVIESDYQTAINSGTALDDSYFFHGLKSRDREFDVDGNQLTQNNYSYQLNNVGQSRKSALLDLKASTIIDEGQNYSNGQQFDYDLNNGNVLNQEDLGHVQVNISSGQITDPLLGDEKTTTYSYALNADKHILGAPKTKVVSGLSETKDQDYYYDQLPLGQVNKVNLTKEDTKVNGVDVETTYNSLGLPVTKKDPKENTVVTLAYDSANLYPQTSTDVNGRITTTEYDPVTGQLLHSTDPNGYQEANGYDAFGRPILKQVSDPNNPANLITVQEISYEDVAFPNYKEVKDYFNSSQYVTSREYYDGLGRVIQSKKSDASGQYVTVAMEYDSQGRVKKQSLPYFSGSIAYSAPVFTYSKQYTYDVLDRVLTEITPVGTTTYSYDGFTTTITDPRGKVKELTKDAYDNLVQVKEHEGAAIYTTNYEYTLTNKLKKITDAQGNVRNFVYDDLDNLASQDMVHKTSVADPVDWVYTYDNNGNVLTKTDPRSQATDYSYDSLNRILTEDFSGTSGVEYDYNYDEGLGQLNRLSSVIGNNDSATYYTYDYAGRPTLVHRVIDGLNFDLQFAYNIRGDVSSITYSERQRVIYSFNNGGQVNQVDLIDDGVTTTLATNIQYSLTGLISHLERGNGVTTDYTYDPAQGYRLTHLVSQLGSAKLQDISYTYDSNGNILTLTDNSNTDLAKTVTYNYDDLNRLVSATVTNATSGNNYSHTYSYDAIGNMLSNSAVGQYTYNKDNPHQAGQIGADYYTYDANGNVRYINNDLHEWDWRDRMTKSRLGNNDSTYYVYDHNNQRLKKWTDVTPPPPPPPPVPCRGNCPKPIFEGSVDVGFEATTTEEIIEGELEMGDGEEGSEDSGTGAGEAEIGKQPVEEVQLLDGSADLSQAGIVRMASVPEVDDIADYYIDKYYESRYNGSARNHYFLGNIRLASEKLSGDNAGIYYILSDHLGSSSLTTNATGTVIALTDYYPYGSESYNNTTTDIGDDYTFTGKELDEESNLQYFGARYYDQESGRWISIDPYGLDLDRLMEIISSPQQFNGYLYSMGNPVILVDPDGNRSDEPWDVWNWAPGFKQFADAFDRHPNETTNISSSLVPGYGDVQDAKEAFTGKETFTGRDLSTGERVISGAAAFIPIVSGSVIRSGVKAVKGAIKLSDEVFSLSPQVTRGVQRYWAKSNYDDTLSSFGDHFARHGAGRTPEQYLDDGVDFYKDYKDFGKSHHIYSTNEYGIKISNKDLNYYGIYTTYGRAVTHGPIDESKSFLNY